VTLWAVPTVLTLAPVMFEIPEPFDAMSNPLTVKPVRVPTDVMLSCAGSVTLVAMLADATLPTRLEELMFERPEAFPVNKFEFRIPETTREVKTPTDVMLGCEPAVTLMAMLADATLPTRLEELMFERPEALPV